MAERKKVSELFENVKKRPLIYLGKYDVNRMICFLHGFYYSYEISNEDSIYFDSHNKILASRGWKVPSILINKEMERKGLTEEEMIKELLDIEIETWRLIEKIHTK